MATMRQVASDDLRASATFDAEARERLEAMLECAPAFLLALNRLGTIEFINRTLPQYVKADVVGQHWLSFFPPEQHATLEAKLQQMYETETAQVYEATTSGPDGRSVIFETQIAPMRRGGKVVGCVLVAQDVTERKLAQAELLSNRHMALLGTLAAGVAHEINTPIQFVRDSLDFLSEAATSLLSLLDVLARLRQDAIAGKPLAPVVEAAAVAETEIDLPFLRENLQPAFQRSLDGLNKIAKIVRSLKDFAHPSPDEMMPADLNLVIQDALTIATNEYRYVADVKTDFGELPPIQCHAAEISQVVLNIVVNAAHAIADVVDGSERRGSITVSTRYEDDVAIIRISDTGGGIPPEIQARIFDPFFTTKEVGRGTGQGLAIAGAMVRERHRGKLTFETEVGKGTTFVIQLPNPTKPI
jgi:PAS domain S-box-containing protein